MSNEFGYIPESPEQSPFNNKGIFSPTDIYNLDLDNKWTQFGQLELIETITISGTPSSVAFSNLGNFNVHLLTLTNYEATIDGEGAFMRTSSDGGTTIKTSGYQYAYVIGDANGNFTEDRSTSFSRFGKIGKSGSGSNEKSNSYTYLYGLLDSTKYSSATTMITSFTNSVEYEMRFGSSVSPVAESVNYLQIDGAGTMDSGILSLYGIKEYS